ncbi:MAG: hypothetical protein ABI690_29645 [Chloroflexota bacterium]
MEEIFALLLGIALVAILVTAAIVLGISLVVLIATGWGAVILSRDLVVRMWPSWFGDSEERFVLVSWVTIVPLVWAGVVFEVATAFFHEHWFLSLLCSLFFLGCYFYWYFETTPQHHKWPRFVAQSVKLKLIADLSVLEKKMQLRLLKLSVVRWFRDRFKGR